MIEIVPTILATSKEEFALKIEKLKPFARRIHIDISDGKFTDNPTIGLAQAYGLPEVKLDLHLMVGTPAEHFETAASLKPDLIIFHFESEGDKAALLQKCRDLHIRTGLALLPSSTPEMVQSLLPSIDHVLVFTGHLGYNGGKFQADQLAKIAKLRQLKPELEISVDGGINDSTAREAALAGADVLYAGGYIHSAQDPQAAYKTLVNAAESARKSG
ncbi:MAG TPA: hypothetical protein VNA68_02905 [Candidatus Dormibacteraeota bacterium]|nr:hypothetical protein [Candidatus Dormibacteraeota bacterium]